MAKSKALITYGDTSQTLMSGSLLHNLTKSNEIVGYNTNEEKLKYTQKPKYFPLELFGAVVCVLQELYAFFSPDYIIQTAEATEKQIYEFEQRKRETGNENALTFKGNVFVFEIDLRVLFKKQYGRKPSSNNMRDYVKLLRELATTPIDFNVETTLRGETLTAKKTNALLSFAPLPIESGATANNNKRGSNPYKISIAVDVMSIYKIMQLYVKFPNDLPIRLSKASKQNPIFQALIYLLLERRSNIDAKGKKYSTAKQNGDKKLPPYPFKFSLHISQIKEALEGRNIRPNLFDEYVEKAFISFRDDLRLIYKYEIIRNTKGEITKVEIDFHYNFYKESNLPPKEIEENTNIFAQGVN